MNVYDSLVDAAQELDFATRGEIYAACIEYLKYRRMPDLDAMSQVARVLFLAQKPSLDLQIAKSEAGRHGGKQSAKQNANKSQAKAKQNASKGQADGQAKAKQTPSKTQAKAQANAKQNASEQEQEQELEETTADAVAKKSGKRFVPPTAEEVDAYIAEMGYAGFTGQLFCDYYAANGWMRGKTAIRDWRACVRTWANQRGRGRASPQATIADFSAYDGLRAG